MWLKYQKVNNKIPRRKTPTTNHEVVIPTCSVIQLVLFREMLSTSYKVLVRTVNNMQIGAHLQRV